jgi:prohibitin 2
MAQRLREAFQHLSQNAPKGGAPFPGAGNNAVNALTSLLGASALVYGAYQSVFSVDGGHRAVIFNRVIGMKSKLYGEGINFNIPWFERPIIYDIRTKPSSLMTLTGSKDLQMVEVGVRVLHRPDPDKLVWIYQHMGMNYDQRLLPSIMNECAKAVVARYNASELLTKRDIVSADIAQELKARAAKFHVVLEDVAITHLSFSPEYAKAVEAKQVSQQEAERAKYTVVSAQQEKRTIITKAKGEAESAVLIGEAVKKNPGFMNLRRIEAAREIADVVAQSNNKVFLNADSLLLNLLGDAEQKFEKSVGTKKKGWFS